MSSQDRPASSLKKEKSPKPRISYTESTSYTEPDLSALSFKDKMKASLPYTLAVAIIGLVAFWVRMRPSASVFLPSGFVRFISNDAWYHMRTLKVLLHNYPHSMFYNPMTNYPYGSLIHFGPLYDQMLAITSLILGIGNPSPSLVDHVAAYFPAILGALTIIPVYYIGKYLGGHKTGILAAILITFAPGQYLFRSLVGVTDHHVAESLFSTFFMMFFLLALITSKKKKLRFEDVLNKNFDVLKEPLIYSVVAGIMYSAYQLTWPGASLFALIVLIYAVFQYILDNFNNESSDYLGFTGIITFLVSSILILPFVHTDEGFSIYYYSWFHVVTAFGAMIGFAALSFLERELKRRQMKAYYYPLLILGFAVFGLIAARIVAPSLYSVIVNAPNAVFGIQTGGPATIGEASSFFYLSGKFTFARVFGNFTPSMFIVSTLGIFVLVAKVFKKPRIEEVFILVWSLLVLLTIYGQNRFGYYYSINVSILSAYMGSLLLDKVKWSELSQGFKNTVKSTADIPNFLKYIKRDHIIALLLIAGIIFSPVVIQGIPFSPVKAAMDQSASASGDPSTPWLEACMWLNSSTPDPGMDYNAIYQAPADGGAFQYPAAAYGVMSWWDYGHYIETIGHRMPNANPFQAGIGGRRESINETNQPGAATFLLAPTEEDADAILKALGPSPDKVGSRYIVSDTKMATDIFYAMPEWTLDNQGYQQPYWIGNQYQYLPSERYFNTMEARLHIFDGNGLKRYRLVYETEAYPNQTAEVPYKNVYNFLFGGNLSLVDTGYVKIFEYVKGANITGTASPNEAIKISTTIKTDQERTFEYSQTATADSTGRYNFTVPYSTEGPVSAGTQFKTAPSGLYIVSYGATTKEVRVNEEAVMNGKEIKV